MKIFTLVREYFAVIGISPLKLGEKRSLNVKNGIMLFWLVQTTIVTFAFLLFEAKTFREHAECFYGWATAFINVFNYATIVWKIDKIFHLIENFENAIQKRE